jgi:hypothetical protein
MKNLRSELLAALVLFSLALPFVVNTALAQPKANRKCNCGAEACLTLDDRQRMQEIVGIMTVRSGSYILNLDAPACGKNGERDFPEEIFIHLIPAEDLIDFFKGAVGRHVHIQGYPFEAETAWHRTNIMFEVKAAERLSE